MIRLLLLRHAKAVRNAKSTDKDRALEKRGRIAAARIGAWMRQEGLRPDLALVSDAQRTRETFAYAAKGFEPPVPARLEPRIYEAAPETLLRLARMASPQVGSLLMIGHNPGIAEFATFLSGDGDGDRGALSRMRLKFPTGALAELSFEGSWPEMEWGGGRLLRFVTPGSLSAEDDDE